MTNLNTKARMDGMYFVLLGSAVFLLFGTALRMGTSLPESDLRFIYFSSRCILQGADPYKPSEFMRVSLAEKRDLGVRENPAIFSEEAHYIYLPTSMILAPLAALPWKSAVVVWHAMTAVIFLTGSVLMWQLAADYAPILSGFLVFLVLSSNELILAIANPCGIVIGLCCISAWCFIRNRFEPVGVFCLGIGLLLKPHDAGLIWLYFLLAGGIYRKRALQSLLVTIVLGVPTILWVTHVAPAWLQELGSNLAFLSAPGHLNDPGPTSNAGHGIGMLISLQPAISLFRDDPRIYNPIAYFICAVPLLIWMRATFKAQSSRPNTYVALAAIAALSMLPVYHRIGDAKLLLLTVPACAMLWAEGGLVGRIAFLITTAGIMLTGDLQWAIILGTIRLLNLPGTALANYFLMALQVFPVPGILLAVSCYYLWVYVKGNSAEIRAELVKS